MPAITGVDHFALTVNDLEVSVPWYQRVFGLDPIMNNDHEGSHSVVLKDAQSGLIIGLYAYDANTAGAFAESQTGLDHLSFGVAGRADLEAWQQHLTELDVPQSPIADEPYGSGLVFRDPDNIQLEFFAHPGT